MISKCRGRSCADRTQEGKGKPTFKLYVLMLAGRQGCGLVGEREAVDGQGVVHCTSEMEVDCVCVRKAVLLSTLVLPACMHHHRCYAQLVAAWSSLRVASCSGTCLTLLCTGSSSGSKHVVEGCLLRARCVSLKVLHHLMSTRCWRMRGRVGIWSTLLLEFASRLFDI